MTVVPLGQGSNTGEDMDICKCIVPLRHGGTLNSRRGASPLVRRQRLADRNGHELVAVVLWARVLMPLQTRHSEGPMYVKCVEAQNPPIGHGGYFGEEVPAQMSSSSFNGVQPWEARGQ
ncbi:hypothetical protein TNCV_2219491 [Trichonephila clavipes]|nr:hypothetical protein TNCV_2219491 [Trichonephila clavipes]